MNSANTISAIAENMPRICEYCGQPLKTTSVTINGYVVDNLPCYASCGCERSRQKRESLGKPPVQSPLAKYRRAGIPEKYLESECDVAEDLEALHDGYWVYISGMVGDGKTMHAACMAKALVDLGFSVRFESTRELCDERFRNPEVTERLRRCDALFLDDIGKEADSAWAVSYMFEIIDMRYRDAKPLCVTSNYDRGDLARAMAVKGDRNTAVAIASRFHENTRILRMEDIDRRRCA